MTQPQDHDAVLGGKNRQPRPFDAVLGSKAQKSEPLNIEFLSGGKGSPFCLTRIQEFKEPELVGWPDNSIKIGASFTNSSKLFSLKFEFANLDWDIRQLCQELADGPRKVRIVANNRQIDDLFLYFNVEVDYHEPIPRNNESRYGLVSMALRKEA